MLVPITIIDGIAYPGNGISFNGVNISDLAGNHNNRNTSVACLDKSPQISIYPNPTTDRCSIQSNEKIEIIKIYSSRGILISQVKSKKNIDLTNLSNGLYLIEIITKNKSHIEMVVKQ